MCLRSIPNYDRSDREIDRSYNEVMRSSKVASEDGWGMNCVHGNVCTAPLSVMIH